MHAELVDFMGTDLSVVNAARVSFDKESDWDVDYSDEGSIVGVNCLSDRDKKLIYYLANHGHWTPFSHPQITLREKVPIFVARQRFKHMVGFSYNEVSRRYVDSPPEFFVPDSFRTKAENKKQGSGDDHYRSELHKAALEKHYSDILDYYQYLLDEGICPEQARMILPQSMYTEYYVTGSLAAWARMYNQRTDSHAQKEIQDLALAVGKIIAPLYPVSWSALTS